jgi:hypothetical protein
MVAKKEVQDLEVVRGMVNILRGFVHELSRSVDAPHEGEGKPVACFTLARSVRVFAMSMHKC